MTLVQLLERLSRQTRPHLDFEGDKWVADAGDDCLCGVDDFRVDADHAEDCIVVAARRMLRTLTESGIVAETVK